MSYQPFDLKTAPFVSSWQVWTKLSFKTIEMLVASAQVIGIRTQRMMMSGVNPSAKDQAEFTLMGKEKLDAATESSQAMLVQMTAMQTQWMMAFYKQTLEGVNKAVAVGTSTNPNDYIKNQAQLVQTMSAPTMAPDQMAHSAAKIAHKALKPIHARATANAKRLTRVK